MSARLAILFLALGVTGCFRQGGGDTGSDGAGMESPEVITKRKGTGSDGAGAGAREEIAKLKGTWFGSLTVPSDNDGRGGEVTVEVTADTVKISKGASTIGHAYYSLDPTKNPKWIDLKGSPRSDPPMPTSRGIYELEGDQLKICMGGGKRPTKFAGGAGSTTMYYQLTRK